MSVTENLPTVGYVYFILDVSLMFTKIGCTSQFDIRVSSIHANNLSISTMFLIKVEGAFIKADYERLEKDLHDVFSTKSVKYEWFDLGYDDYLYALEHTKISSNFKIERTIKRMDVAFNADLSTFDVLEKLHKLPIDQFQAKLISPDSDKYFLGNRGSTGNRNKKIAKMRGVSA